MRLGISKREELKRKCQINSTKKCLNSLRGAEKAESEIKRIQQQTNKTPDNGDRRVRVERLVTSCKDARTKTIKRHGQILDLTLRLDDSASLLKGQEVRLNVLTKINDEVLKRARQYIESPPGTDKTSQSSSKTTKKTVSTKSGNSLTSKASNQRQKDLHIAKHCREELERQHESALRLAKQKQEFEQQTF